MKLSLLILVGTTLLASVIADNSQINAGSLKADEKNGQSVDSSKKALKETDDNDRLKKSFSPIQNDSPIYGDPVPLQLNYGEPIPKKTINYGQFLSPNTNYDKPVQVGFSEPVTHDNFDELTPLISGYTNPIQSKPNQPTYNPPQTIPQSEQSLPQGYNSGNQPKSYDLNNSPTPLYSSPQIYDHPSINAYQNSQPIYQSPPTASYNKPTVPYNVPSPNYGANSLVDNCKNVVVGCAPTLQMAPCQGAYSGRY